VALDQFVQFDKGFSNIVIFLQIKIRPMKTWEERFTRQTRNAEKKARKALKKGNVEKAHNIAMRVQKRAKISGFVSYFTVLLQIEHSNSRTSVFQTQAS
jgi:hypothetical protein